MNSRVAAALLASFIVSAHATEAATPSKPFRIAMNLSLWGNMPSDSADQGTRAKKGRLRYYTRLGYTHVVYGFGEPYGFGDPKAMFDREGGDWRYNRGDLRGGPMAASFRTFKSAAEDEGLKVLPFIETLSHVQHLISMDPSVSEFPDWQGYCKEAEVPCGYGHDRVAALADSSGAYGNRAADQFFQAYLELIRANWDFTPLGGTGPEAIHIGHDELGEYLRDPSGALIGSLCFVKAGRSRGSPHSRSKLVALEIDARMAVIETAFGSGTAVIAYGDSFLPGDNGEAYGLIGAGPEGAGGVLALLAGMRKPTLIVMPWAYSTLEGETFPAPGIKVDRPRQIRYLQRLGYRYIPGTGEDGGAEVYAPAFKRTRECLLQWIRAAGAYPNGLAGYAHLTFEDFRRCEAKSGLCVDYSAPLLAWAAWTRPYAGAIAGGLQDADAIFAKVDVVKSVADGDWKPGRHYAKPDAAPWWRFWR